MAGGWGVALMLWVSLSGCAGIDVGPKGHVTLYGRAAPPASRWFGLNPAGDPPQTVGFGADGVACLDGPAGTDIVWFAGAPENRGAPRQVLGRVPGDGGRLVMWVEVKADGGLASGQGVPAWWDGDAQACP